MTPEVRREIRDLLLTANPTSLSTDRNGFMVVAMSNGSMLTIKDAEVTQPNPSPDNTQDTLLSAGHLTDPFSMPTPACLGKTDPEPIGGGNTCHPKAPDMFPGPGV